MSSTEIWVIDDEVGIRSLLSEILEDEGYVVRLAQNATEARALRAEGVPALALLDIWMPDTDGLTLLKEWKSSGGLNFPVVMLSGHATIDTAVEATRVGAFDFLEKPIGLQKLLATVQRALKTMPVARGPSVNLEVLGTSPPVQEAKTRIEGLLRDRRPILLTGEPGAGFNEAARALHLPNTPWLTLETGQRLIASPLEIMEQARGGTLYCADVCELTRSEQRSLVFILQRAQSYSLRAVCASSEPLSNLVAENGFDPSLYTILSPCAVVLPPLRQRRADLPALIDRYTQDYAPEATSRLTPEAREVLEAAPWPGNLVQLQSVLSSLLLGGGTEPILADHLTPLLGEVAPVLEDTTPEITSAFFGMPLREARESFERVYFENLLKLEEGNMSRVAEKAGLERTHLYRKLKQLNIKFMRRGAEAAA